jgi:fumarate reductase subunit C
MGECKTSIINPTIIMEWIGTLGEFMKMLKPSMPPCSGLDNPDALAKWLIIQAWVGVLSAVVGFVMNFLSTQTFGIIGLAQGILIAFLGAWISWFMLCKREPSCCCFCIVVIEGWKQMHLIYGLLMILQAVLMIIQVVQIFLDVLAVGDPTLLMYSAVTLAITILYNITWFFIGLSATKIGAKKAGVEIPEAPVGKSEA